MRADNSTVPVLFLNAKDAVETASPASPPVATTT